ncbi:MAG: DUF1501 domain-containing protein [Burkholderiaceae bacterium]
MDFSSQASRREFLRRAGALGTLGAAAPLALNLAAMTAASAQTAGDDYRALVCVFLYGGNDNHNTIVPFDLTTYNQYAAIRTNIAVAYNELASTELVPARPWPDGRQMSLNPALAPFKTLFDNGHLALAMNIGTLIREGTTLDDYERRVGLPPKLFSHNDQQSVWQSSLAEGAASGWGGRMGDLLAASNGDAAQFTSISASGNAVMMSGNSVIQYQVGSTGSIPVNRVFGSTAATDAMKQLLQQTSSHLFEDGYASVARRSIEADARVNAALETAPDLSFPASRLGAQLKTVARLIAARAALGVKRQVFFVSQGGFDNHNDLITLHPNLLETVSTAMKAFFDATVFLGVQDQVTSFTGADFGRTLSNNGDGSDHGWGSYHFVMGGAVQPRTWVGSLPAMSVAPGPDNVGNGRLLPAIGVDQYGATLARWFGVSDAEMSTVFPNINNYSNRNLGFLRDIG